MTAAAVISCTEPDRLALAMARHFGHKVPVEQSGAVTSVFLAAGRFELEPGERRLAVRASAQGEGELADVKHIAENHLTRFARPEAIEIDWELPNEQDGRPESR